VSRLTGVVLIPIIQRETAATLEAESGYKLESTDVVQLRRSIENGLWDDAADMLIRLGVTAEGELRVRSCRFFDEQCFKPNLHRQRVF
jgi:hypothetical protein